MKMAYMFYKVNIICTFMTEQVAREVNLRAFELPFTIVNAVEQC